MSDTRMPRAILTHSLEVLHRGTSWVSSSSWWRYQTQAWTSSLPPLVPGDVGSVPAPPPPAVTEDECRLKYIDDLTLGEVVNLDTQLASIIQRQGLFTYHYRHGLVLPPQIPKLEITKQG